MMLRMKRRVMRRLVSICLIDTQDRPKGLIQPTRFCKSNLWDVAVERTSRRLYRGDELLSTLAFGTSVRPSGRFRC